MSWGIFFSSIDVNDNSFAVSVTEHRFSLSEVRACNVWWMLDKVSRRVWLTLSSFCSDEEMVFTVSLNWMVCSVVLFTGPRFDMGSAVLG